MDDEFEMERKPGIILWIPRKPDFNELKAKLAEEIKLVEKTKTVHNKTEIIALLEQAKLHINAFPGRRLRFYIDKGRGCPNDVNLDEAPSIKGLEDIPFFRYNPRKEVD